MNAREEPQEDRLALVVASVATMLVVAYAVLAAIQILVLNPLAAVPGKSLSRIRAELVASGESLGTPLVLLVMGLGIALAIVILVETARHPEISAPAVALVYLALLAMGGPAHFFASFPAGMGIADTYLISGGDHSHWSTVLYAVSTLALLAIVGLGVGDIMRTSRSRPQSLPAH